MSQQYLCELEIYIYIYFIFFTKKKGLLKKKVFKGPFLH